MSKEWAQCCECKHNNPKHPPTDDRWQDIMDGHGVPVVLLHAPDRKVSQRLFEAMPGPLGNACLIVRCVCMCLGGGGGGGGVAYPMAMFFLRQGLKPPEVMWPMTSPSMLLISELARAGAPVVMKPTRLSLTPSASCCLMT